jgi:pilus assembly protein Flp/PilA
VAGNIEAAAAGGFFFSRGRANPSVTRRNAELRYQLNQFHRAFAITEKTSVKATTVSSSRIRPHGACQMSSVFRFLKDESGATAIEYGLIAAGISIVIIASVNAIGTNLNGKFNTISTQLK